MGAPGDIDLQALAQRLGGDPAAVELDRTLQDGWRAHQLRVIAKGAAQHVSRATISYEHPGGALIEGWLAGRPTIAKQRPQQHRCGDQRLVPPSGLEQASNHVPVRGLPVECAHRPPWLWWMRIPRSAPSVSAFGEADQAAES